MVDISRRRDVAAKPSIRYEWLLACAVVLALAALTAVSTGSASRSGVRAASTHDGRQAVSKIARFDGDAAAQPAAPVLGPVVPGDPDPQPRVAERTMSMDDPIQGGLTAHQEQAISARLISGHRDAATAPKGTYWTPAMGRSAVARAESWLGMPYSWAGGNAAGPSLGRCEVGTGGDLDCHVVGFDCSGLTMYAWGSYLALPHLAATQRDAGAFHPSVQQLLPGDLVFFSGYIPGGIGHVAIYTGDGMVIEAPQSGQVVHRAALADMMTKDGVYRGAVRPGTGQAPALTAPKAAVPAKGGVLTLRGTHLAGVDAVQVGDVSVQRFTQHSDTAITFRAPAHAAGTVAVTATTAWHAQSKPVALSYAKPKPKPAPSTSSSSSSSKPPATSSKPPSSTAPTATTPTKPTTPSTSTPSTPAKSAPAKSAPAKSAPAKSAPSNAAPSSSAPSKTASSATTTDPTGTPSDTAASNAAPAAETAGS